MVYSLQASRQAVAWGARGQKRTKSIGNATAMSNHKVHAYKMRLFHAFYHIVHWGSKGIYYEIAFLTAPPAALHTASNGRHGSRAWQKKKTLGISFHMKPAVGEEEYHWHSSSSTHWLNCNFEGCKISLRFHVQSSRKFFVISCELCDDFCLAAILFLSKFRAKSLKVITKFNFWSILKAYTILIVYSVE